MSIAKAVQDYRKIQKALFNKVMSDVEEHWHGRIIRYGMHELGERGAHVYLERFGKGIGEKKAVHLAMKAEIEGYQDMAWGFWKRAYECSARPKATKAQTINGKSKNGKHPSIKILFLASNPRDTERLRLDEEMRLIDQALLMAEFRDAFAIQQQWAVRTRELSQHFLRYNPDIVHFSGHGSKISKIILQDESGNSQTVPPEALSQLFSLFKEKIRCVILNACYSEEQARAIAEHIDCVIGMSRAIEDTAAVTFASAFYRALGHGRNVEDAFQFGCVEIGLQRLSGPDIPQLLAFNANPKDIFFVKS